MMRSFATFFFVPMARAGWHPDMDDRGFQSIPGLGFPYAYPDPALSNASRILAFSGGLHDARDPIWSTFGNIRQAVIGVPKGNIAVPNANIDGFLNDGFLNANIDGNVGKFLCKNPNCWSASWNGQPGQFHGKSCKENWEKKNGPILGQCGRSGCRHPRMQNSLFCQDECRLLPPEVFSISKTFQIGAKPSDDEREALQTYVKNAMKTRAVVYLTNPRNPQAYPELGIQLAAQDIHHRVMVHAANHVSTEAVARVVFQLGQMTKSMCPLVLKRALTRFGMVPDPNPGGEQNAGPGIYIVGRHDFFGGLSESFADLEAAGGYFIENGFSKDKNMPIVLLREEGILAQVRNPDLALLRFHGQKGWVSKTKWPPRISSSRAGDAQMGTTIHELGHLFDLSGQKDLEETNQSTHNPDYKNLVRMEYFRLLILADLALYRMSRQSERIWDWKALNYWWTFIQNPNLDLQGNAAAAAVVKRVKELDPHFQVDNFAVRENNSGEQIAAPGFYAPSPYHHHPPIPSPPLVPPQSHHESSSYCRFRALRELLFGLFDLRIFKNKYRDNGNGIKFTRLDNLGNVAGTRTADPTYSTSHQFVPLGFGYAMVDQMELVACGTSSYFNGTSRTDRGALYLHIRNIEVFTDTQITYVSPHANGVMAPSPPHSRPYPQNGKGSQMKSAEGVVYYGVQNVMHRADLASGYTAAGGLNSFPSYDGSDAPLYAEGGSHGIPWLGAPNLHTPRNLPLQMVSSLQLQEHFPMLWVALESIYNKNPQITSWKLDLFELYDKNPIGIWQLPVNEKGAFKQVVVTDPSSLVA